jgi:hypothetical protein
VLQRLIIAALEAVTRRGEAGDATHIFNGSTCASMIGDERQNRAGANVGSSCTKCATSSARERSQTDTYLSAKIAGLRESRKRFDAGRGKPVANTTP